MKRHTLSRHRPQTAFWKIFTMMFLCLPPTTAAQYLEPRIDRLTGSSPLCVEIADLDGDKKPDVIVAVYNESRIGVFRNTGTTGMIHLAPEIAFSTNVSPQGVITGDFDGDGKLDIATANSGSGSSVSIRRNLSSPGSIQLDDPVVFPVNTAHRVRAADLDGDSKLDLVTTSNNFKIVSVFQNTSSPGTISFVPGPTISVSSFLRPLALGDIDADNKIDIVIAVPNIDKAIVYRNNSMPGQFSFAGGVEFTVGRSPGDVFLSDIDGDGALDILTSDLHGAGVSVLRNTSTVGAISFASFFSLPTGVNPEGIIAANLDDQGGPEILTVDSAEDTLTIFKNLSTPGTLAFAPRRTMATGDRPSQLASGDLDADGWDDIVVSNINSDSISAFHNTSIDTQAIAPFLVALPIGHGVHSVRTARISAVMDHHVPWEGVPASWISPYNCATTAVCQTASVPCGDSEDRLRVMAFDGQIGDSENGENPAPSGYRGSCLGEHFLFSAFLYAGGSAGGDIGICPGGLTDPESYLDYDGHSGYDFNYPGNTDLGDPIFAAAAGWLEIPQEDGDFVNAPCSGNPKQFNSLRIRHANGLETWYLHAIEGSECIPFQGTTCTGADDPNRPASGEEVWVEAGARIGSVGDTGTASPHLHFEVRQSSSQRPLDPFGCSDETRQLDPGGCATSNLWSIIFVDDFESGNTAAWGAVSQ